MLLAVPLEEPDRLEPLGALPAEADPVDEVVPAEPVEEAEPLVALLLPELAEPITRSNQQPETLNAFRRVTYRKAPVRARWRSPDQRPSTAATNIA